MPFPYHLCSCRLAHGHTGVFHNTSFDINYWHNFCLKHSPVCNPLLVWFFAHFRNTSLPKSVPFFLQNNNFKNSFSPSLILVSASHPSPAIPPPPFQRERGRWVRPPLLPIQHGQGWSRVSHHLLFHLGFCRARGARVEGEGAARRRRGAKEWEGTRRRGRGAWGRANTTALVLSFLSSF